VNHFLVISGVGLNTLSDNYHCPAEMRNTCSISNIKGTYSYHNVVYIPRPVIYFKKYDVSKLDSVSETLCYLNKRQDDG
jgi:hypothetical protein